MSTTTTTTSNKVIPPQVTFNKVVRHLLRQKRKAFSRKADMCQYRTRSGLTCAAGCLITKKEYKKEFEGTPLFTLLTDKVQSVSAVGKIIENKGHNLGLVNDLRSVHDDYKVRDWKNALEKVGEKWGLKMPTLKGV